MWLLHRWNDREGAIAVTKENRSERRRNTIAHATEFVPLRHAYAHSSCSKTRRRRDEVGASKRQSDKHCRRCAMTAHPLSISRRSLLAGGGALIVSFSLSPRASFAQQGKPLPGNLRKAPFLDSWIRIGADGKITVFTGKSELGQGIKTALRQVAAEELSVKFEAIDLVTSDTAQTVDEGFTSGSQSMSDSGTAILNAAAQVRELLISLASAKLSVDSSSLKAQDGRIVAESGQSVGFGDLVAGEMLHVQAQPESKRKDPRTFSVVGQPVPRVDIPGKVTGGEAYVQDMRMPGMVHARIVV